MELCGCGVVWEQSYGAREIYAAHGRPDVAWMNCGHIGRVTGGGLTELKEVVRQKAVILLGWWWIEGVPEWKGILRVILFCAF